MCKRHGKIRAANRLPSVETSIPTYSPSTHGGTVPPKTIGDAPTDFPSNEQSSATPTEQIKNLRGDTPAPSEDPSHAPTASPEESSTKPSASSSGEPSLFRSAPPSEQQSENPSESPTAQPTTLHPSTVQPTTSQPTLSSSPTQTIEPLFPSLTMHLHRHISITTLRKEHGTVHLRGIESQSQPTTTGASFWVLRSKGPRSRVSLLHTAPLTPLLH